MWGRRFSGAVRTYPLQSPQSTQSLPSLSQVKKYHIIFIPQACSGAPDGQAGAARSGARDGRGGGRASSPTSATARHTGEHLLPTKRAATASRCSVLSSAVAWLLLPRAPVVTQLVLLRQPTIARPLLPRTGGSILGAKARCRTGLTSAVGRAYNGAETGDKAWEHEPPSSFRETTARSSPGRGEGIFEKMPARRRLVVTRCTFP
jgi:hypothetical protein